MPCVIGQHSPRIEGPWCKRHGPCVVAFPRGRPPAGPREALLAAASPKPAAAPSARFRNWRLTAGNAPGVKTCLSPFRFLPTQGRRRR